jgi:hypothetical protein
MDENGNIFSAGTLSYKNTELFSPFRNHFKQVVDTDAVPTISGIVTGLPNVTNSLQYVAGVAVGDKMYYMPRNATQIMVLDTTDDSISFIGNFAGTNKFFGSRLAPNGYIYSFGLYGSTLKFNPEDNTYITFGGDLGGYKWVVGDRIYMIQTDGTLDYLDTNTDTVVSLGAVPGWIAGVMRTHTQSMCGEIIYYERYSGDTAGINRLGKLNLTTFTYTYKDLPSNSNSISIWGQTAGVTHPNGKIYLASDAENRWAIIDTLDNDSIAYSNTFGDLVSTKHVSCCMGSNGKVYNFPFNLTNPGSNIEELDVETNISTVIGGMDDVTGGGLNYRGWYCATLMPNGNIYSCGQDMAGFIMKIGFNNVNNFSEEFTQSKWFNQRR